MYKNLQSILNAHLAIMPSSPRVAWENVIFEPQENEIYLEPKLFPSSKYYKFVGENTASYQPGIYQINVVGPKGLGWGQFADIIEQIENHFTRGLELTDGDMTIRLEKVEYNPAINTNEGNYIIPVSIYFYTYYKN